MSKLRLFIKRPGTANTYIPMIVEENDSIGNGISSLIDHFGFPRRDGLGRLFSYSLRPISDGKRLSNSARFVDAHLLPETRLVLELENTNTLTREANLQTSAEFAQDSASITKYPDAFSHQMVNRRTFLIGSVLSGSAVSGLFTGAATAFATRRKVQSAVTTHPVIPSPKATGMLQQSLLFSGHQQTVRAVNWSPDGNTLASGADDASLLLWTPDGQVRQRILHPAGVTALAWSPTGQELASGSGQGIRFFDGQTAALLAPVRHVHTALVTSLTWSSSVGHPLVSGSLDMQAIIWETQDYQPQAIFRRHNAAINALSCQSNSTTVASASQGGAVRVWSVDTLQELHGFYQDAQLPMSAVAFAPARNQLAVGGNDGLLRLWRNGLICQQSSVAAQDILCVDEPQRLRVHTAPIRSIAWSPDGHYLATGGEDNTLAIWSVSFSGQMPTLFTTVKHTQPILALSWSPTHQRIAVASGNAITIWTLQI